MDGNTVHLKKLGYCFYWQLLREMQINTFGTCTVTLCHVMRIVYALI